MKELVVKLKALAQIEQLYLEEGILASIKKVKGTLKKGERKDGFICMLTEDIATSPDNLLGLLDITFLYSIQRKLCGSMKLIDSIKINHLKHDGGTYIIVITFDDNLDEGDFEYNARNFNLLFLKLLSFDNSIELTGYYNSGDFYFDVSIDQDNELKMDFVGFD